MNIVTANSAGFCWGVRRAVEIAQSKAIEYNSQIFTDGPLIHNRNMIAKLEENGIKECKDPSTLPPKSVLIIRAHGIPPQRRKELESLDLILVDATCLDVRKIQNIIKEKSDEGFSIIILGDNNHAEVVGLVGHSSTTTFVVAGPQDIDTIARELSPDTKICFVSQSTQSHELFEKTEKEIRKNFPHTMKINTICRATNARQSELHTLAKECDAFVIVGSPESANTKRLAEIASLLLPTFIIDNASQINKSELSKYKHIGISAGASTPDFIIKEVEKAIKEI